MTLTICETPGCHNIAVTSNINNEDMCEQCFDEWVKKPLCPMCGNRCFIELCQSDTHANYESSCCSAKLTL